MKECKRKGIIRFVGEAGNFFERSITYKKTDSVLMRAGQMLIEKSGTDR